MIDSTKKQANILGCYIDLVNMQEAVESIGNIIANGVPGQIVTLNAEIIYRARQEYELQQIINSARLVTPDGIGVVWAARSLGYQIKERVTGIDLLNRLCELAAQKGWSIYLLGAAPGVAAAAGEKLIQQYPRLNISGIHDGYFSENEQDGIIEQIKALAPDILCVALGAPRQEYWIKENMARLGVPVCIGVGGSFDVISGIKERAPEFMIKMNLEWLYRLVKEPTRIKRQLALPRFALQVLKHKYLARGRDR
ncbi:MAG: WecB/TagA/CpsF family glycosyltransferase [Syntrophomonadaceae bacterium]|nr:WecB/TagA/CpsF family glycosyltransferase [Syntrophomonadaceae bacterium]MDD3889222.1 WecB/TagA/CpsF family glycosyltransferase [Syntrophomonadaceae bacterium]MDD4549124.1 WecB/TagA/CpsF family glycosyltransferase [Syntrophomonadaceae bacterium]